MVESSRQVSSAFHGGTTRAGFLLRQLEKGKKLEMPHARSMPAIGERCHELRIVDQDATWRIICRIDADAIVIVDVFSKINTDHAAIGNYLVKK